MRYVPAARDGLLQILVDLPDDMKVETDAGTGVTAKTVAELRMLKPWPMGLAVEVPKPIYPESAVKISRAS